ncbi:MAG TPA: glycosyltransferase family 61 protein [Stellaceae bacterium]|nr:glycosyltransferase family 61 protein [Stellaceae bacterium]
MSDLNGSVSHAGNGIITGWLFSENNPAAARTVSLYFDGKKIATLLADGFNPTLEEMGFPEAIFSQFEFKFPGYAYDEIAHLVQVYDAEAGAELPGSPICLTLMEGDADCPFPVKSVSALQPVVVSGDPLVVSPSEGKQKIYFELMPGTSWIGPRRSADLQTFHYPLGGPLYHRGYCPWLPYIVELHNVYLGAQHGQIFFPDGTLWRDCRHLLNGDTARNVLADVQNRNFRKAKKVLSVFTSVTDNYFHWHSDTLPAALLLRKYLPGDDYVILGPVLKSWQKQSLERLGATHYIEAAGTWQVETLLTTAYAEIRSIRPDHNVKAVFRSIAASLKNEDSGVERKASRIFISREDAQTRRIVNEHQVWSELETRGFSKVLLSSMAYTEQVRLFAQAEIVVAAHGAGLTNIGFCKPGTKIIEIIPRDVHNGCFRYLSILMRLRHFWIPMGSIDKFEVDMGKFTKLITNWCQ